VIDLGTLGETCSEGAYASAINDAGLVVGTEWMTDGPHALLWDLAGGPPRDLAGGFAFASEINDLGQVTGGAGMWPWEEAGFLWDDSSGLAWLPMSRASGLNELGQVTGQDWFIPEGCPNDPDYWCYRPLVWDPVLDVVRYLDGPDPTRCSYAGDINDLGQIVGQIATSAGWRAVVWPTSASPPTYLPMPEGITDSVGLDINNLGQVAGEMWASGGVNRGFFWDPVSGLLDLGSLCGSWTYVYQMNNLGQVVGLSHMDSGSDHAFVWDREAGMVDIGLVGGTNAVACGINDRGQIVGGIGPEPWGWPDHAVLWEPTPVTATAQLGTLISIAPDDPSVGIAPELEQPLLGKVAAAQAALAAGNANAAKVAINDLKALVNQVEAQTDKKIAPEVAAKIIERANGIIAALNAQ
jgi:probable HAF family extracellular repeat protein